MNSKVHGFHHVVAVRRERIKKTEVEGNRTQFQNSFDGNDFGNDADSMRAKTYAFEADSDSPGAIRCQLLNELQQACG